MTYTETSMLYTFKGRLCGLICSECPEPLSIGKVRIYRTREDQNIPALAVADPKDTFTILTDEMVEVKAKFLLAEVDIDAKGSFTFELGANQNYGGEAFDIDFECGTVPGIKFPPRPPRRLQLHLTTIQPQWRQTNQALATQIRQALIAAWEYSIPSRYWCAVRARFDAWTICGRIVECNTQKPVAGVKVRAFDTDLFQDDDLGFGITDNQGKFRIDYTTADFQKTPWSPSINFEIFSGPDLYFQVETIDGKLLLSEDRSRGRQTDRGNVGNCFCVELCLPTRQEPEPEPDTIPLFTNVGTYHVDSSYGDFTSDGLTSVGNYAFTDTIPLNGVLPDGQNSKALEYRFRVAEYNLDGTLGPISDVVGTNNPSTNMIEPTNIGKLVYWQFNSVISAWEEKSDDYYVNKPGALHNVSVESGGWIKIPRENDFSFGGVGRFVPNGDLIKLITTQLTNEFFDLTTPEPELKAGESVPSAERSRVHTFKLFFEAREVEVSTLPLLPGSNSLDKIVISNTSYTQHRHPNWAGEVTTLRAAVMLDILELATPGGGCEQIQNHVHALYTVYHPFLESARVSFEGNPPFPVELSLSPIGGEAVSGIAGYDFDVSALEPCAYILWLKATLNLTQGNGPISDISDHLAFCKSEEV